MFITWSSRDVSCRIVATAVLCTLSHAQRTGLIVAMAIYCNEHFLFDDPFNKCAINRTRYRLKRKWCEGHGSPDRDSTESSSGRQSEEIQSYEDEDLYLPADDQQDHVDNLSPLLTWMQILVMVIVIMCKMMAMPLCSTLEYDFELPPQDLSDDEPESPNDEQSQNSCRRGAIIWWVLFISGDQCYSYHKVQSISLVMRACKISGTSSNYIAGYSISVLCHHTYSISSLEKNPGVIIFATRVSKVLTLMLKFAQMSCTIAIFLTIVHHLLKFPSYLN